MQAAVLSPPGRITLLDVPAPVLGTHQVRISVRAASANRADLAQLAGTHQTPSDDVLIAGLDAAGDVVEVGSEVDAFRVGDRVMALAAGGMAEQVVVDAGMVVPIPAPWTYAEGAAAVLALLTEHNALRTAGRLRAGEHVMVHAAASGVGLVGARVAKQMGAGLILGSVRSDRATDVLARHGVDHVVRADQDTFSDTVLELTDGRGADLIVDHVGGPYLEENVRAAAIGARLVGVGRLGGVRGVLDMETLAYKRLELIGVTFRTRSVAEKVAVVQAMTTELDLDDLASSWRPEVWKIAELAAIDEVHAAMAADAHVGKLVVTVGAGA